MEEILNGISRWFDSYFAIPTCRYFFSRVLVPFFPPLLPQEFLSCGLLSLQFFDVPLAISSIVGIPFPVSLSRQYSLSWCPCSAFFLSLQFLLCHSIFWLNFLSSFFFFLFFYIKIFFSFAFSSLEFPRLPSSLEFLLQIVSIDVPQHPSPPRYYFFRLNDK